MPSKSPLLLDQYRCFFCPGSKMHNNDIMANVLQGSSPFQPFVSLFGLHAYSFTNIKSTQSIVASSPCCIFLKTLESWHNPFTMETEWLAYVGLGWNRLFCWWSFCDHVFFPDGGPDGWFTNPTAVHVFNQSIVKCVLELYRQWIWPRTSHVREKLLLLRLQRL